MNITRFDETSLTAIYDIEVACNSHPWSEKLLASCIGGRYITRQLQSEHGKIVGFYIADWVIDEMTLMEICVHPAHQGLGLGQHLLDDLFKQARQNDVIDIHLEVRASNQSALHLYQKNGFVETYRRKDYYPSATHISGKEDAIVMKKSLG
ncbi:ribosomal protein S18-alanine N-acetyltransferase [Thalassotalea maritima]|uniref:ribosomal protein S18-alanine N-acetyltransferase n=1 Tax=Thalassotalea maritima TaxID=3242416 RepID=UPI0035296B10